MRTIPVMVASFIAVTVLLPLLVAIAVPIDAARSLLTGKPWMTLRMVAMAWIYLASEVAVIVISGAQWLVLGGPFGGSQRLTEAAYGLQQWWVTTLLRSVASLLDLRFRVEGKAVVRSGPIVVLFRHASIIDNLLPYAFITSGGGVRLRWVLKKELLSDPALDIGGHRLPNYFVDREAADPEAQRSAIRALATDLGPDEGVLIFPEGTRFSAARRRRALERVRESDPELYEQARHWTRTLPPRRGGVLALLEAGTDVVVCAHGGLEGLTSPRDIWRAAPVGRMVAIRLWRISAADVPAGDDDRARWLADTWSEVDAVVGELAAEAT
jgi:1-acyl-sn-glycerol-3-phosphate acyltransferase